MNTNGQDMQKGRKLKMIVATIIAAVVILFVGVWAISSAMNSNKKSSSGTNTEVAKTSEKEKTNIPTGNETNSPSEQYSPTTTETTPAPVVTEAPATTNMPTTGPSEVIFSAIMVGVVASLAVWNLQLSKENH